MKIKNLRLGFATNSSSSHSIIIAGTNDMKLCSPKNAGDYSYGWERFICDTKERKKAYFAAQLHTSLRNNLGDDIANYTTMGLFGLDFTGQDWCGVDHQSSWDVPVDFEGNPNISFYKEFAKSVIDNPEIHVLGGNDNDSYTDENQIKNPEGYNWVEAITEVGNRNAPIAYKTKEGDWILFNKVTGAKVVLNFKEEHITKLDFKPEFPELIDLKITNYCPIGCSYCYQDSTEKGLHASIKTIRDILPWENKGLFEIAIGGGEPTMHPDFVSILEIIREKNIIPNFTTKNMKWFSDMDFASKVLDNVGGFAYSIDSCYEAEKVLKKYESMCDLLENYEYQGKINFQYIPEAHKLDELENVVKILSEAHFNNNLTLLGYKTVGRGGKQPHTHPNFISELIRLKDKYNYWFKIGIDTVLAKRFKNDLEKQDISEILYYEKEGLHSMYIDAVDKKYGASSFTETYHELPKWVRLDEIFDKINIE